MCYDLSLYLEQKFELQSSNLTLPNWFEEFWRTLRDWASGVGSVGGAGAYRRNSGTTGAGQQY